MNTLYCWGAGVVAMALVIFSAAVVLPALVIAGLAWRVGYLGRWIVLWLVRR